MSEPIYIYRWFKQGKYTIKSLIPIEFMIEMMYESHIDSNKRNHDEPSNVEGIHYLAVWHLERQSYHQVSIFLIFYNKYIYVYSSHDKTM